jgi:hypothetical protein
LFELPTPVHLHLPVPESKQATSSEVVVKPPYNPKEKDTKNQNTKQ